MRKKILVCGSTGFLMANFIRYIVYRSKNFEIISIDNINRLEDTKRIYFNKNHKFYIGDASDIEFMKKLIYLEKPDFIICGDEIFEYDKLLNTTNNLTNMKIPFIMILPVSPDNDPDKMCIPIKNIIIKSGNTALELPNKFGMRQNVSLLKSFGSNLSLFISYIYKEKVISATTNKIPWVYAEDVASLLWFLIENKRTGLVRMPPLGYISEFEIVQKINQIIKNDIKIMESNFGENLGVIKTFEFDQIGGWVPDSKDLESSLEKTIKWVVANKWSLI